MYLFSEFTGFASAPRLGFSTWFQVEKSNFIKKFFITSTRKHAKDEVLFSKVEGITQTPLIRKILIKKNNSGKI